MGRFPVLLSLFVSLVFAAPSEDSKQTCYSQLDGKLPSFTPSNFHFSGNVRRYYIAAEELEWDYAPTGWDNWLGVPFNLSAKAQYSGYTHYGTKWLKALYRGYTNASFSERTLQPPFQGSQGPTIRAEVGDLIEIMFINKLKYHYATMHSMGLAYTKPYEGSDYPNNTMPGVGTTLPIADYGPPMLGPEDCIVYKWMVNDEAGPSNGLPAKIHSYHSYVSLQQDANAGLIGPTIIYASGKMNETVASYREFPILYNTYDEDQSFLSGANKARIEGGSSAQYIMPQFDTTGLPDANMTVWKPQLTNFESGRQFDGAPIFFAINGFVYANNPLFEMCVGDNVIWGSNAYGSASHVFHMHGNGVVYQRFHEYAESINDGVGKTLYSKAVGEGLWQVICHVQNHHTKGMVANYRVYSKDNCPLAPLKPLRE
ncbi:hypothetical protein GT037_003415 [Alternaria burnsii]|uniref:Cupredoxin n=1 Tax=Alternaria burnsii TaxID=1187904 RepID=A0A8H7B5T8_9PLEO|nr:uncharacterized protein GT037_003415 [Alternaria burnsii]KAF7678034.1 hypothetical protein GT037_003415 [Alternaria burnsii]CAI9630513.1 unnamed protein product [Alternaria burnsii]